MPVLGNVPPARQGHTRGRRRAYAIPVTRASILVLGLETALRVLLELFRGRPVTLVKYVRGDGSLALGPGNAQRVRLVCTRQDRGRRRVTHVTQGLSLLDRLLIALGVPQGASRGLVNHIARYAPPASSLRITDRVHAKCVQEAGSRSPTRLGAVFALAERSLPRLGNPSVKPVLPVNSLRKGPWDAPTALRGPLLARERPIVPPVYPGLIRRHLLPPCVSIARQGRSRVRWRPRAALAQLGSTQTRAVPLCVWSVTQEHGRRSKVVQIVSSVPVELFQRQEALY